MLVDPKTMRFAASMSSAVMTKALLLYAAFRAGQWLDSYFGTYPFLMVGLLTVAAAIGFWFILYVIEKQKAP